MPISDESLDISHITEIIIFFKDWAKYSSN